LAKDLGYHALALDVTASALLSSAAVEPFSDFRSKLVRPGKDALALAETLADALPNGHEKSIAQTIMQQHTRVGSGRTGFPAHGVCAGGGADSRVASHSGL
jgi:hypothetical protein